MDKNLKGVCFGEILFDVFPDHKEIGGAPLNVASRLNSFGVEVAMISAIGKDDNGNELLDYFKNKNLTTQFIQVQTDFPTGVVQVTLNKYGDASYTINYPAAWDKILATNEQIEIIKTADFLVFGSLVARDEISKNSLLKLISHAKYKIFDINLRKPHYSNVTLIELMKVADLIKLNDEELVEVSEILKSDKDTLEGRIQFISEKTATPTICVTLGANGSSLYKNKQFYYNNGYKVKVQDTVGAGDSFLASLIFKLLTNENPQEAIDFASAVGALVASKKGANAILTIEGIQNLVKGI